MKKIVLLTGSIIGTILTINMLLMVNRLYSNPDFKGNDVVGYTVFILLFSLIFFGIRNYRNKYLGGFISFSKALVTGVWITLVASSIYVIVWLFYYYLFVPDFIDVYTNHVLKNCAPGDLAAKTAEMESFKESYKNPAFVVFSTFLEVAPIGFIVSIISALILKKKATTNSSAI
ncbi:DUF4199 domain-containing protein [Gynurincola endophyticus]|uniref:DUF4199 domain-containing protein n=1 Tax=Gynurincola endophyticus TaxID=2479004 RepID=UPI000F8C8727|nr:DUF4199 domain-containing protein [Gynurincola endophyticus]